MRKEAGGGCQGDGSYNWDVGELGVSAIGIPECLRPRGSGTGLDQRVWRSRVGNVKRLEIREFGLSGNLGSGSGGWKGKEVGNTRAGNSRGRRLGQRAEVTGSWHEVWLKLAGVYVGVYDSFFDCCHQTSMGVKSWEIWGLGMMVLFDKMWGEWGSIISFSIACTLAIFCNKIKF